MLTNYFLVKRSIITKRTRLFLKASSRKIPHTNIVFKKNAYKEYIGKIEREKNEKFSKPVRIGNLKFTKMELWLKSNSKE